MTLAATPARDGSLVIDADQVFADALLARVSVASHQGRKPAAIGRYVGLQGNGPEDISRLELDRITGRGYGCWLSQHAPKDDWTPSAQRAIAAGEAARRNALAVGYPEGAHLQYDLEGVVAGTAAEAIMEDADVWATRVRDYFQPLLYVGWKSYLTPEQLWELAHFHAYSCDWAQREVANRGFVLKQFAGDTFFGGVRVDLGDVNMDRRGGRLIWAASEVVTEPDLSKIIA